MATLKKNLVIAAWLALIMGCDGSGGCDPWNPDGTPNLDCPEPKTSTTSSTIGGSSTTTLSCADYRARGTVGCATSTTTTTVPCLHPHHGGDNCHPHSQ